MQPKDIEFIMIHFFPSTINRNCHSHGLAIQQNVTNFEDNSLTSAIRFWYKFQTLVEYNTYMFSPYYNLNIQLKYKINVTVRNP